MPKYSDEIWGVVPARGGSKSIPYKNLLEIKGRSLIDYVFQAGKSSAALDRIVCSTDDERISAHCRGLGLEVSKRPDELAQDDTPILDVLLRLLEKIEAEEGKRPLGIVLLQPTSPFVLPQHVGAVARALREDARVNSAQTVALFPHNFHAFNQREVTDGLVKFRFARQRKLCYNKQTKPKFHIFGNLVGTRSRALLRWKNVFAPPSAAIEIPYAYALDVDGPGDPEMAEFYLDSGRVRLDHLA